MAGSLADRLARFVTRCGKRVKSYAVYCGAEKLAEVPADDSAVDELLSAAEDAAASVARQITCVFRALDGDGQPLASLTAVVRPPVEPATGSVSAEAHRVIQLLAGHAQELTRLVIASQQAILSAYQSALRDASRRAAEAEARALAAEDAAAEVLEKAGDSAQLPPAVQQLLAALPALSQTNGKQ